MNIPQRYTSQWWLWLGTGGLAFGLCTCAVLYGFGIVTDPMPLLLVALAGSALGDLLMAFAFEAFAPTNVTIGPGERVRDGDALTELAEVVSGFQNSPVGTVRVRGELWSSQSHDGASLYLGEGDKVHVLARQGLSLLVRAVDAT